MKHSIFNRSIRLLLVLLCIYAQSHCTISQSAFISLDCGGTDYVDPYYGFEWASDESFVHGGLTASVTPPSTGSGSPQFTTIRYFPGNQTKYCYSIPGLTAQSYYLVRASFWLGSAPKYETIVENQLTFKLLIGADEWANISIALPQENPVVQEIYVRAMDIAITVCLSGKGIGLDAPFISTIELRPLSALLTAVSIMAQNQTALFKEYRLNLGVVQNTPVRYPDDSLDRIWDAWISDLPTTVTSVGVGGTFLELLPVVVMQTALGGDGAADISIDLAIDLSEHVYMYQLYFAEIDPRVNSSGQRVFDIYVNRLQYQNFDIYSKAGPFSVDELYSNQPDFVTASVTMSVSLQAVANSTYGPLINGLEIFRVSETPQSNGTFARDVIAIQDIVKAFGLSGWAGDPCLPYAYNWLKCTQPPSPVRINALFLSNQSLVGTIPPSINDLTELVQISLDRNELEGDIPNLSALTNLRVLILNNNNLSGTIPEFLSNMPNLKTLLLQYNNFSGQIPAILLLRSNDSSLDLNIAGNPLLCKTGCAETSSHEKSNHLPLIIGLLAGFVVVVGAAACYAVVRARRSNTPTSMTSEAASEQQNVIQQSELRKTSNTTRVFSYNEIETATDNFGSKLGDGGSGPVYRGTFQSVDIAVKVLSDDSRHGVRQFLNEVAVLSQVNHKNLVRLVGYCIERKLVLVYAYMSRGSLSESLHGVDILFGWRTRLRIALDAAQGLEYLHCGCIPRIIHRDVKASNILLNENMEAKIGDFGISKAMLASGTDPALLTTRLIGSRGYIDPEYANSLVVTEKIDVFGFGVVLLELISGQPPLVQDHQGEQVHIIDWARELLEKGKVNEMVDNRIANEYNVSALWRVAELAMTCVDSHGNTRPTMTQVCTELREALQMEFEKGSVTNTSMESLTLSHSMVRVQAR